jgi:hypothetical protein
MESSRTSSSRKVKALSTSVMAALLLPVAAMPLPLPKRAKIVVDERFENGDQGSQEEFCKKATVAPIGVSRRIRSYHEITDREFHDRYDFVACGNRGRILLDGKTYQWTLYITDTMDTTYPDNRLKRIAGKPNPNRPVMNE